LRNKSGSLAKFAAMRPGARQRAQHADLNGPQTAAARALQCRAHARR